MKTTFRIEYDDDLDDVVNTTSERLEVFGLIINDIECGDGWVGYEISKIENL